LRDVNTICRRSWYIAAHIWKIYDFNILNGTFIINFSTDLTSEIIKKKDFFLESLKLIPTPYINEMYILLTNISE
jgi:hypothetical protein